MHAVAVGLPLGVSRYLICPSLVTPSTRNATSVAKFFFYRFERHAGILYGIMQNSRGDRRVIQMPRLKYFRRCKGVVEIRFAAFALLSGVRFFRERVCPRDQAIRFFFYKLL